MSELLALTRSNSGAAVGLRIFFAFLEVLIIGAGLYMFRNRKMFFGYKGEEGDTYASANTHDHGRSGLDSRHHPLPRYDIRGLSATYSRNVIWFAIVR